MKIALVGPDPLRKAFKTHLGAQTLVYEGRLAPGLSLFNELDVLIDLGLDQQPERLSRYAQHAELTVLGGAVFRSLSSMVDGLKSPCRCRLIGINALPWFISREILECSAMDESDRQNGEEIMGQLGLKFEWVEDQVGMVTPRVLAMIFNEAWLVKQAGTATREDVELAMKLGTNWPEGPFAWAEAVGLPTVVKLLDALRTESGQQRYAVAPALRRAALNPTS